MGNDSLMSFSGLVGLVTRRWLLVVPGLALTAALAVLAYGEASPRYETSASVVLLPPHATVGPGGNPYLAMGGLEAAADVAAASLSSQDAQQQVAELGAVSTVVRDGSTAAPILRITVEAPTSRAASEALDILVESVAPALEAMQASADVKADAMLGSKLIAAAPDPVVSRSPQLRTMLAAVAMGLGGTLVLVALVDRLIRRRRRTRRAAAIPDRASRSGSGPEVGPTQSLDRELADLTLSNGRG